MSRRRQPSPDEPEYLPSTPRAVAWGALFFALLSFLISLATLFLTWQDGRLAKNAGMIMEQARQTIGKMRSEPAAPAPASEEQSKIRAQLDRYMEMIRNGDSQAGFYLDSLREDLDRLRENGAVQGGAWLEDASATVQKARDELRDNAPGALERLRGLASNLGAVARIVAPEPSAPPDQTP